MEDITTILDSKIFREKVERKRKELGLSYQQLADGLSQYRDDLALGQSQVWKLLNEERGISLDEAQGIIEFLQQFDSIIPFNKTAGEFGAEKISEAYDTAQVQSVVKEMWHAGLRARAACPNGARVRRPRMLATTKSLNERLSDRKEPETFL